MFRRLIRARRRVPLQSAGHESPDRTEGKPEDEQPSPDVYHACIGADGPFPLFIEDLARDRLRRPDFLRQRARSLVSHVGQEERNAAQAWSRLQQLYQVFQAIQTAQENADSLEDGTDEVAALLASGDANDTVLNDFHELTSSLPEGFSPQMFAELGNALYNEMVSSQQHAGRNISRQSFENLGDQLFSQSASASVSSTSSSSIVTVTVSA